MPDPSTTPLVLVYLGEPAYHRGHDTDDLRPACTPRRIRGVLQMRVRAETDGLVPCARCWPNHTPGTVDPNSRQT